MWQYETCRYHFRSLRYHIGLFRFHTETFASGSNYRRTTMNARTTPTPAELADRSVQLVAWMMFALALALSLSVVEFFVSDSTAGIIDAGSKVLGVAILGLGALLFFWKFRSMSRDELRRQVAEDGFLQTAFQKAMARSWMLSFLLLVILQA